MNWIEVFGFVTALACVYLGAKENIWNWPLACLSVIAYAYIFYQNKLYGDMGLQFFFLAINIKGWVQWSEKHGTEPSLRISYSTSWQRMQAIIAVAFLTGFLTAFLKAYTDSDVPMLDAVTTSLSIVAQIQLSNKKIENWFLWIIANVLYVGMYLYKALYVTAILYVILIILAVYGYLQWKRMYTQIDESKQD